MVNPVVFLNYWVMIEVIAATIIFPDFGETIPNPETQVGTISMYYGSSDGEFGID